MTIPAIFGTYVVAVPPSITVRRARFATFIARECAHAKETRGWSIPKIATEAKISNQTIYRWRDGTWKEFPNGDHIRAFCDALDIEPADAFAILWPGKKQAALPAAPLADPDIVALARRIQDPKVPANEKAILRNSIKFLVGQPSRVQVPPDESDVEGDVDTSAG